MSAEAVLHTQAMEFALGEELPRGVCVLEASAGTGKTHTIAGLAARYVAEGVPLERQLLITFTRNATGELRERVRERLLAVRSGLDRALASGGHAGELEDPIVALLAAGEPRQIALWRQRLARALADFDAATIATTHGFCQEVLASLGVAADLERDAVLIEDPSKLINELIADLYLWRFYRERQPALSYDQAQRIARAAVAHPDAELVQARDGDGRAAMRVRLAQRARKELETRKRALAVMTYDDLLSRLDAALRGEHAAATAARLRSRFDVVMVDEFQDTDRVQWSIISRAFAEQETDGPPAQTGAGSQGAPQALILIADPKQGIYAFRGADIYSYLQAARHAGRRITLSVNWRSDQALLDAYDALFGGARLGHPEIGYRPVRASGAHRGSRLLGAPVAAALRFRVLDRRRVALTATGFAVSKEAREHVAADLAQEIVRLLGSEARIERRARDGRVLGSDPLRPGQIAVLVGTNRQAQWACAALTRAGVPAVTAGAGSVFATEAARDWLTLLEALERPSLPRSAHAAALGRFFGWPAERLALAGEQEREHLHQRLHDLAAVLRDGGVAPLLELMMRSARLPGRLLGEEDGERALTDLRHVGELLHAHARESGGGASALRSWLRERIDEAGSSAADEQRTRRLDSDAEAVAVLTVHRSKGLEFPIVCLPFIWDVPQRTRDGEPIVFHDPDAGDQRKLDVTLEGSAYRRHRRQYEQEQRGEDLRLSYVALTRACQQAIVWWAGAHLAHQSALSRLLFCRDAEGNVAPFADRRRSDDELRTRLAQLAAAAPGRISIEESLLDLPGSYSPSPAAPVTLAVARLGRSLDDRWRRTSYSDMTRAAHEALIASEPEAPLIDDEPEEALIDEDAGEPILTGGPAELPLAAMGVGARVGTFVHRVLQATDFAAENLERELCATTEKLAAGGLLRELGELDQIRSGLRAVIETPLGPLLGDRPLRSFGRRDRLDELAFELPLVGGEQPRGSLTLARLGEILRVHLPSADPLAGYPPRLLDPALARRVNGYLTGSLDLVLRLPDGRFAVVDYKTNWLARPGLVLSLSDHRPRALAAEMNRRHYGLQAILYAVALHRFLRWRLPGHDPDRAIAGVLYLFVRGMVGPRTPSFDGGRCGVFAWAPPAGLLGALSDALDRGDRA